LVKVSSLETSCDPSAVDKRPDVLFPGRDAETVRRHRRDEMGELIKRYKKRKKKEKKKRNQKKKETKKAACMDDDNDDDMLMMMMMMLMLMMMIMMMMPVMMCCAECCERMPSATVDRELIGLT